jgi:hypothetical protein
MDTAETTHRRSLAAPLLAVVTLATVGGFALWLLAPAKVPVEGGSLWPWDVAAICDAVELEPKAKDEPLIAIFVTGNDQVEVTTGVSRGPLDGSGHTFTLEKKDGVWTVVESTTWLS